MSRLADFETFSGILLQATILVKHYNAGREFGDLISIYCLNHQCHIFHVNKNECFLVHTSAAGAECSIPANPESSTKFGNDLSHQHGNAKTIGLAENKRIG